MSRPSRDLAPVDYAGQDEDAVQPVKKQKVFSPRYEELQRCISKFSQQHKDELPLEDLKAALNTNASTEWQNGEIEELLQQMEGENRIMYSKSSEVVWVI